MTIAPFQQFIDVIDAIGRHIARKRADDMPDYVPSDNELGRKLGLIVPNYEKPGIAERVAREAMEAEWAQNPPRSSLELLQRIDEIRRFEQSQKKGQ